MSELMMWIEMAACFFLGVLSGAGVMSLVHDKDFTDAESMKLDIVELERNNQELKRVIKKYEFEKDCV